ncbi:MAG: hypothetical protein MIO92_12095 [Methanosarcinaceae archaeon]|nr:hypothetical protein [Methanosarcinaceae archaeon]
MLNLIENGEIIQTVQVGSIFTLPNGDVVSPAYAGWSNEGYALSEADPEPMPVPDPDADRQFMNLSFAQLMIGLVTEQWITEAEGSLWLTGTLPPQVQSTIAMLPAENQFAATAKATRPSTVERMDPLVQMMALAQGRSDAELDDFFRKYASI